MNMDWDHYKVSGLWNFSVFMVKFFESEFSEFRHFFKGISIEEETENRIEIG